jgi:uncharacterized membrane protein
MFDSLYLELTARVALFAFWSSFWPRQLIKRRLETLLGFRAYRVLYNLGTILLLGWSFAFLSQHSRETVQLWDLHGRAWFLPLIYLIEGAGVFFLAACTQLGLSFWGLRVPSSDGTLQRGGFYKITRHPLYWSVFCFLFGHLLALGSGLAVLYFVLLEVYNLVGVVVFENRALSKHFGREFTSFHAQTSALPFKAIVQGKARLRKSEIPVQLLLGAAAFTVLVALLHDRVFVSALRLLSGESSVPSLVAEHQL